MSFRTDLDRMQTSIKLLYERRGNIFCEANSFNTNKNMFNKQSNLFSSENVGLVATTGSWFTWTRWQLICPWQRHFPHEFWIHRAQTENTLSWMFFHYMSIQNTGQLFVMHKKFKFSSIYFCICGGSLVSTCLPSKVFLYLVHFLEIQT